GLWFRCGSSPTWSVTGESRLSNDPAGPGRNPVARPVQPDADRALPGTDPAGHLLSDPGFRHHHHFTEDHRGARALNRLGAAENAGARLLFDRLHLAG